MSLAGTYHTLGFVGPLRAFEPAELDGIAESIGDNLHAGHYSLSSRRNRHLDLALIQRLSSAPAIVDCASQLLGERLTLWRTNIFLGWPGYGLPWHQDQYRTLLADPVNHISVHIGLTDAPPDNCLMLLPESHRMKRDKLTQLGFNHIAGTDKGAYGAPNYWRNPAIALPIVKMTLKRGEFFIFHPSLLHASFDCTRPAQQCKPTPAMFKDRSFSRVGLSLRITVPGNEVFPAAFAETLPRKDRCVPLRRG